MNPPSTALAVNPYDSAPPAEHYSLPTAISERTPLLDIAEGTFLGFSLAPVVGVVFAGMLFVQTACDGYENFVDFNDMTAWSKPPIDMVLWRLVGASMLGSSLVCALLGSLAGLLIALQPRLTQRGLLWQMMLPVIIVCGLAAEYTTLMGWWPFLGTDIPAYWHLCLASGPAAVMLLAGLAGMTAYKLGGRAQYLDLEAVQHGYEAQLVLASWLRRKWRVQLPMKAYEIDYQPMGLREHVKVDGRVVAEIHWPWLGVAPRFDFPLDNHAATIEVRIWPWFGMRWLMLRVDDRIVYGEGTPP